MKRQWKQPFPDTCTFCHTHKYGVITRLWQLYFDFRDCSDTWKTAFPITCMNFFPLYSAHRYIPVYSGIFQSKALAHKSRKLARLSMITIWIDNHYVLGFVPALRTLPSQILSSFYRRPLDETINWSPVCIHTLFFFNGYMLLTLRLEFSGLWEC